MARRRWLASGLCSLAICGSWKGALADEAPAQVSQNLLVRHVGLTDLNTRAKIAIELNGKLQLKPVDFNEEKQTREADVQAKSTLDYYEKIAFEQSQLRASARRYVAATAENWIAGKSSEQALRPECAETRCMLHEGMWQQYCPDQTLQLRETQLIHSPINTAVVELLLPKEPAKPNSSWTYEAEDLATIFNLEAVHQSSLTARIAKVEKGVATIELEGDIQATANSVPTSLSIKGNLQARAAQQCVLVTWIGLAIKEKREISQSEPGFDVTARVRMIREETVNQFSVTAPELAALPSQDDLGRWLVSIHCPATHTTMLGDRRWRTFMDTGEETVLRLIDNNTIIAQCNVARAPALKAGTQLTLEGMQADIRKTLGNRFEEFLVSDEKLTSSKLRHLRSVATGAVEEVPIQWIYNQLSDDSGRRVSLVYTMGGNMTDRFAAADEQMTSSLEFQPIPDADKSPTPAPEVTHSAEAESSITK